VFFLPGLTSDTSYKATLKGDVFQLKLLMAVAITAHSRALKFVLNTEVKEADKFDDLVIEYEDVATVLQAKHSSKTDNYNKNDFKAKRKGEASLAKYFDSFIKISEKDKTFSEKKVNYVFFTNRGLEQDGFFESLEEAEEFDENLSFKTEASKCWQFSKSFREKKEHKEIYEELCQAIKEGSLVYYKLLSKDLHIDISEHKDRLKVDFENLVVKISDGFHALYTQKNDEDNYTIDLTGKCGCTDSRNLLISMLQRHGDSTYAAFSEEFVSDISLTAFQKQFREKLLAKLCEKLEIKKEACLPFLNRIIFKLPKDLFHYVWMPRNGKNEVNIEIKQDEKGDTIFTWKPTQLQAYYVLGMFGKCVFTYDPETNSPLSDLPMFSGLHAAIIGTLQKTQNSNVQEVEAVFSKYLVGFFSAFKIKAGQPNEDELEQILQTKLHATLMFSGDEYYSQLLKLFLNWLKDFAGKPITKEKLDDFFKCVSVGIQRLHLVGYSEHVLKTLDDYPVDLFSEPHVKPIEDFIMQESSQPVLLLTGNDALSLTLAASQVVKRLKENKQLKEDSWGFVSSDCRILDKVPDVLSQHYQLMVIDHVDELLSQQELLLKIVRSAIDSKKKLVLICQDSYLKTLEELLVTKPEKYIFPDLTDEEIENACRKHKEKYIFVCGREIQLHDILKSKKGGVYKAMHSASLLSLILKLSKENSANQDKQKEPVYIPQKVKEHAPYYTFQHVIQRLPSKWFLALKGIFPENIEAQLSTSLVLSAAKLILFNEKSLEEDENYFLKFIKAAIAKEIKDEELEKQLKNKSLIIVNISESVDSMQQLVKPLLYLRKEHKIILLHNKKEIYIDELPCVFANWLNQSEEIRVLIPLADRHHFGQPEFVLLPDAQSSDYTELDFLSRQNQNCSTCVTADPGTGKSENFRELTRYWSASVNLEVHYHWVIQVNLIDIDEQFVNQTLEKYLISYLCKTKFPHLTEEQQQLWVGILKHDINIGYVKLLLDGWDEAEANEARRSLCLNFIESLPETVHYDIAMRPYVFNSSPCAVYRRVSLLPFTDIDLKNYFERRFHSYIEVEVNSEKLNLFVQRIINWLNSSDQAMMDVVRIPLLAFLLSEALKEDWLIWMSSEISEPEGPWGDSPELNLVMLYDIFIIARAKIFLKRISGVNEKNLPNDNVTLQLASSFLISMEEIAFSELFGEDILKNTKPIDKDFFRSLLDFGIVTGRQEDQFNSKKSYRYVFLQQTFKELFAALFIVRSLSNHKDDLTYCSVRDVVSEMRYDVAYKVVWRFVKDLISTGSALLFVTPNVNVRTVFTDPPDLIGVASSNLLFQLGLSDRKIEIFELNPLAFLPIEEKNVEDETPVCNNVVDTQSIDEKIQALSSNVSGPIAYQLLLEFPNDIPTVSSVAFCVAMSARLSSDRYRMKGAAAEKLAAVNVEITVDLIDKLQGVALDSRCHQNERLAAIRTMLKVNIAEYSKISISYEKLLDDNSLEQFFKNEVLLCLQDMVKKTGKLDDVVLRKVEKGFNVKSVDLVLSNEILLRRLLLIKFSIDKRHSFKGVETKSLAKDVALNLNPSRLTLLIDLIKQGFITLDNVKRELYSGLSAYNNRHIAANLLLKLREALKDLDKNSTWLGDVLAKDAIKELNEKSRMFSVTKRLLNASIFELGNNENYFRFWRLDAGIPIATLFFSENVSVIGFSYLIFQIRNNLSAYDVASKISSLIGALSCNDSKTRCMKLYLMLEYLIIHQRKPGKYFQSIDKYSGLIEKMLAVAWEHFEQDRRYPLIGLDVIFSLGVCFGLPLIQVNNKFKLLFPSITRKVHFSPEFSLIQQNIIKKHFEKMQHMCGKSFVLNELIKNLDRESLATESINLFIAEAGDTKTDSSYKKRLLFSFSEKKLFPNTIERRHSIAERVPKQKGQTLTSPFFS